MKWVAITAHGRPKIQDVQSDVRLSELLCNQGIEAEEVVLQGQYFDTSKARR